MAIQDLRDLTPRGDVKGGSPRTPIPPLSQAEYQQYSLPQIEHSNGVWKVLASAAFSLLLGFMVAWWTALQARGVTQQQLEDYVGKHSPYLMDKELIWSHNKSQDGIIGEIKGKQERVLDRMGTLEFKMSAHEKEQAKLESDIQIKMELVADLIEEQRKAKK